MRARSGLYFISIVAPPARGARGGPAGGAPPPPISPAATRRGRVPAGTVISPERSEALHHAYVLLRDDRIARVDAAPPPALAPSATVIDGAGRYLVPGLIDGHVHLSEIPGVTREQLATMPSIAESYFQKL